MQQHNLIAGRGPYELIINLKTAQALGFNVPNRGRSIRALTCWNGENQFSLRVYRGLGAGLALVGMALIGTQPAAALDKLTVGIIPITDYAPIFLGKQKGFFAKHNLDVNIETECRVRWSARKC